MSNTSLLEAKKPAMRMPNRPPKPKIQAFRLLVPLALCCCVSFCSFFADTTRTSSDVGVPSRECSGVREGESEDEVPKMRLRRPDMADERRRLSIDHDRLKCRCRDQQRERDSFASRSCPSPATSVIRGPSSILSCAAAVVSLSPAESLLRCRTYESLNQNTFVKPVT